MAAAPTAAASAGKAAGGTAGKAGARARSRAGAAGDVGAPTAADNRALRAELGAADVAYQNAYEAGVAGEPFDPQLLGDDKPTRDAYAAGVADRRRESRERVLGQARGAAGVRGPDFVNDGAGFLLGLIVYALALNYLQGGAAQARGWIAAKFVNRPYQRPRT